MLTPDADPVHMYTNDVMGIDLARQINNGKPAWHAFLMAAALPRPGEHVVHIGAANGYCTAILAHLVGTTGRVTGIEYASDLADRARANLKSLPQIEILQGDGTTVDFDIADVTYVNAGSTHPMDTWLDQLLEGGRLIMPLTTEQGFAASRSADQISRTGAVFRIARQGSDYEARCISTVAVFPCIGGRDATADAALVAAFEKGSPRDVLRLYRNEAIPEERCWLKGQSWCLAYN